MSVGANQIYTHHELTGLDKTIRNKISNEIIRKRVGAPLVKKNGGH